MACATVPSGGMERLATFAPTAGLVAAVTPVNLISMVQTATPVPAPLMAFATTPWLGPGPVPARRTGLVPLAPSVRPTFMEVAALPAPATAPPTAFAMTAFLATAFATAPWAGPARPAVSAPQGSTLPPPVLPACQDTMAPTAPLARTPAPPMVFVVMG